MIPGGSDPELTSKVGFPAPKKLTVSLKGVPTVAVSVEPFDGEKIVGGGSASGAVSDRMYGSICGFCESNASKFSSVTQAVAFGETPSK